MFKNKIRAVAAGIAAFTVAITALGPASVASASGLQLAAFNGPITCSIQTTNGHYLTAVGGGGRTTDVMHSDATQLQSWEKLTLISLGGGTYAIQTIDGHYLTAVGGGGRITDTIHSDATRIGSWEKFQVACTG